MPAGIDRRWSRVVDVPGTPTRSWHLLDNAATLTAEPVGTLLCVHGNPTWSYLWRRLVAAGRPGGAAVARGRGGPARDGLLGADG